MGSLISSSLGLRNSKAEAEKCVADRPRSVKTGLTSLSELKRDTQDADSRYNTIQYPMSHNLIHILVWGSRLLCVLIALWWPRLWCDPIYTPRQARLSGQALHLPNGTRPHTQDEQAMAIFWEWQQRQLVTAEWGADSFHGIRDPQGIFQTLCAIFLIFGMSSGISYFFARKDPPALVKTPQRTGMLAILTAPLWRIFAARSRLTELYRS